ncbi:glucan endo-1,3-beta-glucosidase 11 [Amborella trichopoda]|uniref:glucan endo-1,3-beta-D-glucosidase n=1 Tax=Amborella trichopoda TaxID=13333 RepID=W1P0D9_AMBTC|nr:glucan endo-1,3-beta-glucosidase 11 [Amborella trichopoda]ERN00410.1 hypothetical protein AMTR_s00100p00040750 [Amborella trichopoda]|eukprot:XP_006837841.3 glucan endo-1,3-beta-glucosidase 11 [Amborella trichopoda]
MLLTLLLLPVATGFTLKPTQTMAFTSKCAALSHFFLLLFFLLSTGPIFPVISFPVGVNYGQIANDLPSPSDVAKLLQSIGINKVKLYDADPRVLHAFANTHIEFIIGLDNEFLPKMTNQAKSLAWVKDNVQAYFPSTKITCITVGNEILTGNDSVLMANLLPAMQSVHQALQTLGLDKQVTISTAHSLAILASSYPPSNGAFREDLSEFITPLLDFHSKTRSPFLINAYPYFAYKANPKQVPLEYVLFEENQGMKDPGSGLHYDNMLFAQIDAARSAMARLGHGSVELKVSETGWPSKGDTDEAGATPDNARHYNGNLFQLLAKGKGTPLKPNNAPDVYVFALFNENMKPGPGSERNYGLFKPDGTPAYDLGLGSRADPNLGDAAPPLRGDGADHTSSSSTSTASFTISSAKGLLVDMDAVCLQILIGTLMLLIWRKHL